MTRGHGYLLAVVSDQVDVARFEALVSEGQTALADGDAVNAQQRLGEALALWRGEPLADFAYDSFAQAEIARLQESRLAAIEARIDADLALGEHTRLVAELEALVHQHPLRERLIAQLMLALYRSGRQAEALECYRAARKRLVDELGLDPGRDLQELEGAILAQDRRLDSPTRGSARGPPPSARRRRGWTRDRRGGRRPARRDRGGSGHAVKFRLCLSAGGRKLARRARPAEQHGRRVGFGRDSAGGDYVWLWVAMGGQHGRSDRLAHRSDEPPAGAGASDRRHADGHRGEQRGDLGHGVGPEGKLGVSHPSGPRVQTHPDALCESGTSTQAGRRRSPRAATRSGSPRPPGY